ncbi:LysR family transcriptional regulator [Aquitalea magnusonii]|uniref:LysR family transcriptional regulator n=1 Tax=Aquitalea magnusonii TaxID=332411 RepID=UPI00195D20FC|nr:LysR family transcriptional regulator [Aquitalea magnusonii]
MAVFATVVEQGSMIAASRQLGMTPSAVSQHISKLEAEHGVSLLHRTTRSLTLTEAGSLFYQGCADMLAAAQLAEQRLSELRDAPVGELRLAAPTGFAGPMLSEALAPLLAAHPRLSLKLFFHDDDDRSGTASYRSGLARGRLERLQPGGTPSGGLG